MPDLFEKIKFILNSCLLIITGHFHAMVCGVTFSILVTSGGIKNPHAFKQGSNHLQNTHVTKVLFQ